MAVNRGVSHAGVTRNQKDVPPWVSSEGLALGISCHPKVGACPWFKNVPPANSLRFSIYSNALQTFLNSATTTVSPAVSITCHSLFSDYACLMREVPLYVGPISRSQRWSLSCVVRMLVSRYPAQGYLAHKKTPTSLGPPKDSGHSATVGSWGAISCERGTPGARFLVSEVPLHLTFDLSEGLLCRPLESHVALAVQLIVRRSRFAPNKQFRTGVPHSKENEPT